jgi:hypothetical protein
VSKGFGDKCILKAEATIKMPRITAEQADGSLLGRAVKCLATNPEFNEELVTALQGIVADGCLPPAPTKRLRNLLTYVKLLPHIWESEPRRAWRLFQEMYDDGRIKDTELDAIITIYSSGVDVHEEMEKVMECAGDGTINEDQLLTVSDELKALARWQEKGERMLAMNTSGE